VLKDFHLFLGKDHAPVSPLVVRSLKEAIREAKTSNKTILITACMQQLPTELQKDISVLEVDLPDETTLLQVAQGIASSASLDPEQIPLQQAAKAAAGLTTTEAEDIMALSIVKTGVLDTNLIADEKAKAIAKNQILELIHPKECVDDIGGLDNLKAWLHKRRKAFTDSAVNFGLPTPKGMLILGIPGTGKSLTAKAASQVLAQPILKLDAGKLFAGVVGQSEANLRHAIQIAEAVAPCILWIDEIEKGISGSQSSGNTDGGTSARVFGTLLSWLQEKTSSVFVTATANDVSKLPPELLRRGRFDELFFVDLPNEAERKAIWRIHLNKRNCDVNQFDIVKLSQLTDNFTGSEIEQVVVDALFSAFDSEEELEQVHLQTAISQTIPLSVTMAENTQGLRQWASTRARPANICSDKSRSQARKLSL
jgi:SpoVK/Ycf46/Vps4 family AAA+-type ATPase